MSTFLRRKFRDSIRSRATLKATLLKNFFTVLAMLASVVWLLFWGIDLIFANNSLPYVKIATVIIGYGVPSTNIYFDHQRLKRRVNFHRFFANRGGKFKTHNKYRQGTLLSSRPCCWR